MTLGLAALNLFSAVVLGALIGSERQVRQRMAGLRTNALVALGAAGFVVFSGLFPTELSPTRVAAQVVTGIGFLGAGIIFREGFQVHGLNTAATLWCSAAVGLMAGAGHLPYAVLLTGLVIFINIGLRPLVKWLKRTTNAGIPVLRHFQITITTRAESEGHARAILLRTLQVSGLKVIQLVARADEKAGTVGLAAVVEGEAATDTIIEHAVATLAADPKLASILWESAED